MVSKEKSYGQYFTPKIVSDFMVSLIEKDRSCEVLEPCAGKGVFLNSLLDYGFKNITACEIDDTLPNESPLNIEYRDFLTTDIKKKYDVIIGNPPYIRWKNIPKKMKSNLQNEYWKDKINGLSDLLYAFIYRCVDKLKPNGELVFITPTFWTQTLHATPLREFLHEQGNIRIILMLNEMKVCEGVSAPFMIFKYIKEENTHPIKVVRTRSKEEINGEHISKFEEFLKRLDEGEDQIEENIYEGFFHFQFSSGNSWKLIPPKIEPIIATIEDSCSEYAPHISTVSVPLSKLLEKHDLRAMGIPLDLCRRIKFSGKSYFIPEFHKTKIEDFEVATKKHNSVRPTRLGDVGEIGNGLVSGKDKAFKVVDERNFLKKEKRKFLPVIKASSLRRYYHRGATPYIFVNDVEEETELKSEYPNIYRHLKEYKDELEERYDYGKNIPWWHWVFLRNWKLIKTNTRKILTPCKERIDNKGYARFALADGEYYATQDVTVIVKKPEFKIKTEYLVGLLNSETLLSWMKEKGLRRGGVLEFSEEPLSRIPIRLIDWNNSEEVNTHNEIVKCVHEIIKTGKVTETSQKIEEHVKKLYGLT